MSRYFAVLELVTDLTTEAFLGALNRFIARRGHCSRLYCDNATNFVGANNLLKELEQVIHSKAAKAKIAKDCASRNIEFIFIPPRAPHFGGLWEAAVKSAKHLLQSALTSAKLTHEEMTTLLAQAEAILNSRLLTPMSTSPDEVAVLTSGHFLIGEPLTATIDPHTVESKIKLLERWKLVAQLKMNIYQLQNRYKWKSAKENIDPGMLVIIKEDNLPPCQWSLGRITNVIRVEDGHIRVADVKTANKIIRRPIVKLAPLPVEMPQEIECSESQPSSSQSTPKGQNRLGGKTSQRDDNKNPKRAKLTRKHRPLIVRSIG